MKKLLFISIFMLLGCGRNLEFHQNNIPKLDLRTFLNGKAKAWGMIENRRGNVLSRFSIEMNTTWKGNEGTLEEFFTFDDGKTSTRTWRISYNEDDTFIAQASDVIGIAHGKQAGNAVNIKYVLDLAVDEKNYKLKMDDWMFQIDEKHLMNKTSLKKFGFTVARLTIFFEKE